MADQQPAIIEIEAASPLATQRRTPVTTTVIELMDGSVQRYDLSCIVCYDGIEISEYKDIEHSMCVIEADRDCNGYVTLPCCSRLVCKKCIESIISTTVGEGKVKVACPHPECGKLFTKEYIYAALRDHADMKQRYQRLLVDVDKDSKIKTCPQCSHLTEHVIPRRFRLKEADVKITCDVCQQEWCFHCHAPWHREMSCKEFKQGSQQFRVWTKSKAAGGVPNCQKCPTCRVYIQRSEGCPHMNCDRCGTEFCYECGGRFLDLECIEVDHYSTLNVWGCRENYYPDNPCMRNFVRWGYLFTKLSYLLAYPLVFIVAFVLFVLLMVLVCVPCYVTCKLCTYASYKRETNRRKRRSHYEHIAN